MKLIPHDDSADAARRGHEQALANAEATRPVEKQNHDLLDSEHKKRLAQPAEDRAKSPPKTPKEVAYAEINDAEARFAGVFYRTLGPQRRMLELDGEEPQTHGELKKSAAIFEQVLAVWEQQYAAHKALIDERAALRRKLCALETLESSRTSLLKNPAEHPLTHPRQRVKRQAFRAARR